MHAPLGRDALVGVLDLVTFASLGVVGFELSASQKCCAQGCPMPLIAGLSGPDQ